MKDDLFVIESRGPFGLLKLDGPQPEHYFGLVAVHGMTSDAIAKAIFRTKPDAVLSGTNIPQWPSEINANWVARRKYW